MLRVRESFEINIYAYLIMDMQTMIKITTQKGPLFAVTASAQKKKAMPITMEEAEEMEYAYNMDIFDINSSGIEIANIILELSIN